MRAPRFEASQPEPVARLLLTLLACLAGTGLAAILDVLVTESTLTEPLFRPRLFIIYVGALTIGGIVGLVLAMLRAGAGRGFLAGLVLGLAPALAQLPFGVWFALGFCAVGLGLAWKAGPKLQPPRLLIWGVPIVMLVIPPIAWKLLQTPPQEARLQPPPALAPVPENRPSLVLAPGVERAPDVLLIVADTLRADTVLDPEVPTPNLDALRARGTWASTAVAPSNQTLPSHLTLLGGMHIEKHGMRANLAPWPTGEQLKEKWNYIPLSERFQQAGYRTVGVVTNKLLVKVNEKEGYQTFAQGFQTWNGLNIHDEWEELGDWKKEATWYGWLTDVTGIARTANKVLRELFDPDALKNVRRHWLQGERTTKAATAYLNELYEQEEPFFMLLHYMDPHTPYIPPEEFKGTLSDPSGLPEGTRTDRYGEAPMREELRSALEKGESAKADQYSGYLHDLYREELIYLDRQIGTVLKLIEERGRPTIIAFTADHGEAFGEHGIMEHGHKLYEPEIAVPFILAGPEIPENEVLAQPPALVDMAKTLAVHSKRWAEDLFVEGLDGRNVLAPRSNEAGIHLSLFATRNEEGHWDQIASLRQGRWKAHFEVVYDDLENPAIGDYRVEASSFFDLEEDPQELRDLKQQHADRVRAFEVELRRRLDRDLMPEIKKRELSRAERQDLNELGYLEGQQEPEED